MFPKAKSRETMGKKYFAICWLPHKFSYRGFKEKDLITCESKDHVVVPLRESFSSNRKTYLILEV